MGKPNNEQHPRSKTTEEDPLLGRRRLKQSKQTKQNSTGFFGYALSQEDSSRNLFFILTAYNENGKRMKMIKLANA